MKYFIKTFGCQMNISDSERIAGFLESQPHPRPPRYAKRCGQANPLLSKERGFVVAKKIEDANLVIFNTCGVRQMAEDRVYGLVHNLRKNNPKIKIILTGCLSERPDVQKKLKEKVDLFFPINKFEKFENWLNCHSELDSESQEMPKQVRHDICNYLQISAKHSNKSSAYIPIMTGCNNFCAYCVVPYARGREVSRPMEEIFAEIDRLAKSGCQEIILLGQNVNSYKHILSFPRKRESSIETKFDDWIPAFAGMTEINFPALLNAIATKFKNIHFKFLTSHPKDFSKELMHVIADNKNISKEIHLPFQAGSNKILRAMNRPYTQKHYLNLIKKAREIIPGVGWTTDVIVGFPGETEKDFQESVKIFKLVNYNEAYINKYSPRPGTAAYSLGDPISWEEKKRREKVLRKIIRHSRVGGNLV